MINHLNIERKRIDAHLAILHLGVWDSHDYYEHLNKKKLSLQSESSHKLDSNTHLSRFRFHILKAF